MAPAYTALVSAVKAINFHPTSNTAYDGRFETQALSCLATLGAGLILGSLQAAHAQEVPIDCNPASTSFCERDMQASPKRRETYGLHAQGMTNVANSGAPTVSGTASAQALAKSAASSVVADAFGLIGVGATIGVGNGSAALGLKL